MPLLGLNAATFLARRRALAAFAGPGAALVSTSAWRQVIRGGLALVAAASLVLALSGPFVEEREVEVRWKGIDLVVALDVSQSMGVQDVPPDRLRAARDAIQSLSAQIGGSRVALVLFGASGVVRYPPTTDPRVIGTALDTIGRSYRPTAGSSLKAALDTSFGAFPQDSALPKAVLVVSDGEDTTAQEADLERFRSGGIRIFAFAVGTEAGGPVPAYDQQGRYLGPLIGTSGQPVISRMHEEPLRRLADATTGRQWRYEGDERPIRELARAIQAMGTGELGGATQRAPDDRFQLFAAFALAALVLEALIGDRRAMPRPGRARLRGLRSGLASALLPLVVLLASCGDAAGTNETANDLFAAGDYQGALERYRALLREHPSVPQLSINAGNALHRLGDFARAVSNYDAALPAQDRKIRAVALYDKGNTLFRMGRLEEAREAYVAALKLDPSDRDAKYNIEVIDRARASQGQSGQGQPQQPGQQPGQPGSPGQSPQPGASQAPGQSPGPGGGQPQPGAQPGGSPGEEGAQSLEELLAEFRENLTPEEALRLLDALSQQQRGVEILLEGGPRRSGPQPEY